MVDRRIPLYIKLRFHRRNPMLRVRDDAKFGAICAILFVLVLVLIGIFAR